MDIQTQKVVQSAEERLDSVLGTIIRLQGKVRGCKPNQVSQIQAQLGYKRGKAYGMCLVLGALRDVAPETVLSEARERVINASRQSRVHN